MIYSAFPQRCPCQPSTSGRVCEPDCFGVRRVSTSRWTGAKAGAGGGETISVTFINRDGSEQTIAVPLGMNMLEAAHANDIELEVTRLRSDGFDGRSRCRRARVPAIRMSADA